ncbi:MAG: hypothetical protein FP826_02430 [Sphingomonadales bacterium]|jgi:hypothetical protein|nr:hypothetical protein [Sphingomonadales bacterium]MBU3991276.1 hypothetical protein [Alphaproteobacteria bacterium]
MYFIKKATLAIVLGATALTAASPAMADPYYGERRGGDTAGAAIAGGIIGLALGAIIASSANNRHDRYAERGWTWRNGYYWDRQGYRYDRDGRRAHDRDGYYNRRGYDQRGYGRDERGYYGRDDDRGGDYGDRRHR